jgi:hypothetical protein
MKIIESYARWDSADAASRQAGVSRLTAARIYNHIRQRLVDCQLYELEEARKRRIALEAGDDPFANLRRFNMEPWHQEALSHAMGRYRGVDPAHRPLYEAEAAFRMRGGITTADMKAYIMEAIRLTGPLNGEPYPDGVLRFQGELGRRSHYSSARAERAAYEELCRIQAAMAAEAGEPYEHRSWHERLPPMVNHIEGFST